MTWANENFPSSRNKPRYLLKTQPPTPLTRHLHLQAALLTAFLQLYHYFKRVPTKASISSSPDKMATADAFTRLRDLCRAHGVQYPTFVDYQIFRAEPVLRTSADDGVRWGSRIEGWEGCDTGEMEYFTKKDAREAMALILVH
jgi:hypothetical protein